LPVLSPKQLPFLGRSRTASSLSVIMTALSVDVYVRMWPLP
jgi:hypothetical protein